MDPDEGAGRASGDLRPRDLFVTPAESRFRRLAGRRRLKQTEGT
jgi:hypothetical protein